MTLSIYYYIRYWLVINFIYFVDCYSRSAWFLGLGGLAADSDRCTVWHTRLIAGLSPSRVLPAMRDFHFSIDRGGTFTDVFAEVRDTAHTPWIRAPPPH